VPPTRVRREVKLAAGAEALKAGDQVLVGGVFNNGDRVDVIGSSRGKGFQGVMKRHNFRGGAATHGSMFHRAPGSIGASSFPSRVVKGMRAAGRMGGDQVTTRNLKVVQIDTENNLLLLRGAVPGAPGTYIVVRKAVAAKKEVVPQVEKAAKVTVAKKAVKGGVEMFMKEKPDMIFFTGDLVNNETAEVKDYIPVFEKLRAPMGVFSVTGNHDYGDYKAWETISAKQRNFNDLVKVHKEMGYDILMNENRIIEQGGEKIAIIGNENWGAGRFSKYGKLDLACKGTEDAAVKLLLSHDPTHWDAQVRPNHPEIDVQFAGHTHGFQFGVNLGSFTWSPVQYAYRQWAGLYQEGAQYLYVNRGFGYIGYPGRVGMPPELTIFELKRA